MESSYFLIMLKTWIYFIFTTLLGFFLYFYFQQYAQHFWIILIVIAFSFYATSDNFKNRFFFILFSGFLLSFLSFIAGWIGFNIYIIIFYLIILSYLSIYVGQMYPKYFYPSIVFNLFIVLSGFQPLSLESNLERSVFILIAMGIVLLSQFILYPFFILNRLNWYAVNVIGALKKLSEEVFSCMQDESYIQNKYLFEKRIYIQKEKFFNSKGKVSLILNTIPENTTYQYFQLLTKKVDALYDNLCDVSLLHYRNIDHSTFGLCAKEMMGISSAINKIFKIIISQFSTDQKGYFADDLHNEILLLEENYQNILKVSSSDPVIFMLFIASLKALNEKLNDLQLWISEGQKA